MWTQFLSPRIYCQARSTSPHRRHCHEGLVRLPENSKTRHGSELRWCSDGRVENGRGSLGLLATLGFPFSHTRLQPCWLPSRAARQLPDQSTILRVESSSADDSRLRGARPESEIQRGLDNARTKLQGRPRAADGRGGGRCHPLAAFRTASALCGRFHPSNRTCRQP